MTYPPRIQVSKPRNRALHYHDPPEMWIDVYVNGQNVGSLPADTSPARIRSQALTWWDQDLLVEEEAQRIRERRTPMSGAAVILNRAASGQLLR